MVNESFTIIKSRDTSRVKCLREEKPILSGTISVLVLRSLMCLKKQSAPDIGLPEVHAHIVTLLGQAYTCRGLFLQTHQYPEDQDRDGTRNVGFSFA
jgi:hypothetical protein